MHCYKIESGNIQVDDRDIYIGSHIIKWNDCQVKETRKKRYSEKPLVSE